VVQALLDLHDKARAIVNAEFAGSTVFQKALKDAFEVFVNKEVTCRYSNTEMIASYADRVLRAGAEKLSDAQIEEALERVVQLFAYIADKDVFSEVYRNQLCKRQLNARSVSNDAERSMISKLKCVQGGGGGRDGDGGRGCLLPPPCRAYGVRSWPL
jgi:cullin 1